MRHLLSLPISLALVLPSTLAASVPQESALPEPCTIRSTYSGAFFDLNPLHIVEPSLSKSKSPRDYSWNTTGHDIGYNFTLNFCGAVVEDLEAKGGVVGVERELWKNVSAFYEKGGKVYSIGQQSHHPIIRGRKLVLNYTHGSPCPDYSSKRSSEPISISDLESRQDEQEENPSSSPTRRKTTIISMLCDRDPLNPLLTLSFIASPDECTYIFEARTSAACAGIEVAKQTLSPSGVFGVIALIAVLVYIVGGCVYSRMVLQQRGWKQVPNYSLWKGIFDCFTDIFIILTSSCARLMPSRAGYQRVNGSIGGRGRGRSGRDSEAANRLIDELNEEWDD